MKICMIITAAGMSKRQRINKLLIHSGNETIIEKTVNNLLNNNFNVFVIVGHQKELIIPRLSERFRNEIKIVNNLNYKTGIASSLIAGIKAAGDDYDYYGFCNGDKPFIKVKTVETLVKYLTDNEPQILVPMYQDVSGHPTFFSKEFVDDFSLISGDTGGREIIKKHPEAVTYLPLNDEGIILDMDKYLHND
ncbi:MAG: nucleotidyltransferase family protein [Candidatus Neomarinimicrobiota bacterium]